LLNVICRDPGVFKVAMGDTEKRILVTDDDDAIRALLMTILRRRGFKVDTARNGVEGLEHIRRCRYSLVLLDLMMPLLSGYGVLEQIERLPPHERPLVLVFTAGSTTQALNPEFVAGAVRKPFDIEMLVDTISACIASAREIPQTEGCPAAETDSVVAAAERGGKPN
jgi:DNA-binding response OmpR family regulator